MSRKFEQYLKGPTWMWDVGGDNHETFDSFDILEFADLSLDDPEFEPMIIQGKERGSFDMEFD